MSRGRFTAEDIVAIRASTEKGCELAKRYGVTDAMISQIRHYVRYGYVRDDGTRERPWRNRLSESEVRSIRSSDEDTETLAERYGISPQMVRRVRRGASYAWVADA